MILSNRDSIPFLPWKCEHMTVQKVTGVGSSNTVIFYAILAFSRFPQLTHNFVCCRQKLWANTRLLSGPNLKPASSSMNLCYAKLWSQRDRQKRRWVGLCENHRREIKTQPPGCTLLLAKWTWKSRMQESTTKLKNIPLAFSNFYVFKSSCFH